jgi:rod shape-determining protein MreD
LIGGLLIDLASGAPTGISSLPLMVAALVAGVGRTRIYSSNLILPALISLFALILYQAIWLLLMLVIGRPVSWRLGVVQVAAPLFLLNMLLMPVVYFVMAQLARLVQGSRIRLG